MFGWLFNLLRPKPKFRPGQLVAIHRSLTRGRSRYLLIEKREWTKPEGAPKKVWVYEGTLFNIQGDKLIPIKPGSCFQEESFVPISDFK